MLLGGYTDVFALLIYEVDFHPPGQRVKYRVFEINRNTNDGKGHGKDVYSVCDRSPMDVDLLTDPSGRILSQYSVPWTAAW